MLRILPHTVQVPVYNTEGVYTASVIGCTYYVLVRRETSLGWGAHRTASRTRDAAFFLLFVFSLPPSGHLKHSILPVEQSKRVSLLMHSHLKLGDVCWHCLPENLFVSLEVRFLIGNRV